MFYCIFVFVMIFCNYNSEIQKHYTTTNETVIENQIQEKEFLNLEEPIIDVWKIEIPKINLVADIAEGTNKEVLDKYVGHFEESSKKEGNICLAGHNRGYPVNYFARLKDLEIGDEILYFFGNTKSKYIVNLKTIIEDTDWSNLESTNDNRITLITCVEDKPSLRRCIQAIEKS